MTERRDDTSRIRPHGWVTPLPGGARARCGGPGLCSHCQLERRVLALGRERDDALDALVDLQAAVIRLTLDDPTHYEVANAVGLASLRAGQVLDRYGRPDRAPSGGLS